MNRKITFFVVAVIIAAVACLSAFGLGPINSAEDIRFGIDIRGGVEATFVPKDLDRAPTDEELESARAIIETRMDSQNILDREVTIDKEGGGIIVRFPWKSDETSFNPEEAIAELGEMARLTFRDEQGNVLLEGSDIKSSSAVVQQGQPMVQLEFSPEGAQKFADATGQLVGQRMSIYMDETMISSPTVNEQITGGSAVIENIGSQEEAVDLANKINSGALPFALETKHFSSISPTMGAGALQIMMLAGLIAFILILLFMLIRYRLAGFVSCIALVLQLAGQILFISIPQITLTLPGIAGVILSLGMGVDANVIISERISEELRHGATVRGAIKSGYHRAFSSVLDGNLTTAIVAIILMIFGSGTMFSFGYTLLAGIILNFVAGVLSTRLMLTSLAQFKAFQNNRWFYVGKDKRVMQFFQKRYITFIVSACIMVVGIISCLAGSVTLDTNFKGGAVIKYSFSGEIDANAAANAVSEVVDRPVSAQVTNDVGTGDQRLVLTFAGNTGLTPDQQAAVTQKLTETNAEANFELNESLMVEPYIGQRALNRSILAVVLAFVLIVIYVAIRFRKIGGWSAGVMALVALIHDVLVVFFAFALLRIPLGDSFIAVVLTIIGYSINDTIVIYDRMRENKRLNPKWDVVELVNNSISSTMMRSVNTALTTVVCSLLMFIFALAYGIDSIRTFALPMTIGLISGCYSTICIAGPLWAMWQRFKANRKKAVK